MGNSHYRKWTFGCLRALRFMHSANVIHRDLKPSNLLLNSDSSLRLCDFGLARGIEPGKKKNYTEYVVTRWYRAPELMLGCHYDDKVDIWAIGCILAEMMAQQPMAKGRNYKDQLRRIIDILGTPSREDIAAIENVSARSFINSLPRKTQVKSFREKFPRVKDEALDLLQKMLTFNPKKRISAKEALDHPWFDRQKVKDQYRDPSIDICPETFNFEFEESHVLPDEDKPELQKYMWNLVREHHPFLPIDRIWSDINKKNK